jgi:hypothetical protein
MNQSTKQQRPLAIAFVLGMLLTLFMGLMVLRMETAMLETGRTGFEGVGGLLVLLVTLLAALVAGAVVWAMPSIQQQERRVQWSRLFSLKALVYFGLLFFVGFQIGPGVVLGDVSANKMLFMLFVMAGLNIIFFAGPISEVEKAYSNEEE